MEAVPRWRALHERYRRQGLRLVVVNTQDPDGRCMNPGWNPDEMVCDADGRIAGQLGVGTRLPSAFLWSWRGDLLVGDGHVDNVERAVKDFLTTTPRVEISATGTHGPTVARLLRDKLVEGGKLQVVSDQGMARRLAEIRKRSSGLSYAAGTRCQAGRALPANSLLEATVYGKGRLRLGLTLYSAEKGCAVASVSVDWDPQRPSVSVAEAVYKLHGRLGGAIQWPSR